jgi:hypothetical protein
MTNRLKAPPVIRATSAADTDRALYILGSICPQPASPLGGGGLMPIRECCLPPLDARLLAVAEWRTGRSYEEGGCNLVREAGDLLPIRPIARRLRKADPASHLLQ